jgi:hypothetical protein
VKGVPDALNRMIDVVLAYRPKPKSQPAKKRAKKKKKAQSSQASQ